MKVDEVLGGEPTPDTKYRALRCDIKVLPEDKEEFQSVRDGIISSQTQVLSNFSLSLSLCKYIMLISPRKREC